MLWFIFSQNNLLLLHGASGDFSLPECAEEALPVVLPPAVRRYAMDARAGVPAVACDAAAADLREVSLPLGAGYEWMPLRQTWSVLPRPLYLAAAHASVWVYWERSNRFCPVCGTPLERFLPMGKRCPKCGTEHFPHLAPASIVRVLRDDKILLVRPRTFTSYHFGLVAGFLEGGETLEECAAREVHEETGLEICNVRYFGSQPWPYPSGVMVGFTADYAAGNIAFADGELLEAGWYGREALPPIPSSMSIARRLIDDWLEGTPTS